MILIHLLLALIGIPVLLIVVGCVWLLLSSMIFNAVFSGG